MCATEDQIKEWLKELPEIPMNFGQMMKPGDFHGIVEWKVVKGNMESYKVFDHPHCETYHTKFTEHTEVSWHSHGEYSDEIIICLNGEIVLIFDDGHRTILKEKDKYVIGKKVKHMAIVGDKPCQILAMTIPKET